MACREWRRGVDRFSIARSRGYALRWWPLGCVAGLVYLERERVWRAAADQRAADDLFARCFAERAGEIDRMIAENVIEEAQAELFKSRAEAMCRATVAESPYDGTPPLPAQ